MIASPGVSVSFGQPEINTEDSILVSVGADQEIVRLDVPMYVI
jgi:hypothetical protein